MKDELSEAIKRYEDGDGWNETDEVIEVSVKQPLDKVIPIRLSADKWNEIRQEAAELGVGPTTLARIWVLEKLRDVRRTR